MWKKCNTHILLLTDYDPYPQDGGVRYICAGIAEQQVGLQVLNLTANSIGQEGFHHISAMLVSIMLVAVNCVQYKLLSNNLGLCSC